MLLNILDCLWYLMQNPVINKLLKNRRRLSILGLRIHIVRRGWGGKGELYKSTTHQALHRKDLIRGAPCEIRL